MPHRKNGFNGETGEPHGTATRRILLLAAPGTQILDLVGPFQVFTRASEIAARVNPAAPPLYFLEVVTTEPGMLRTSCGLRLQAHRTFRQVRGPADTLLVVGGATVEAGEEDDAVIESLRRLAPQLRRIGSICTGAFLLARAALLDGRRATTHWKYCDLLARRYPAVKVDPDPIFVRDGNVYTSAGVTAGMDLALALVEEDAGAKLALEVARELVLYLRRPGGQSQFSTALNLQASDRQPFRELGAWAVEHLRDDLSVDALAERVGMSPRNFARVFRTEMNMTPAKFIESLRLEAARRRLQESNASLELVARTCGFRNCDTMRSTFRRVLRVAPGEYRWRFQARHASMLRLLLLVVTLSVPLFPETPCANMASLRNVTAATETATYCRVSITLRPTADSEIKSEVWLPAASVWNGKLLMEGGGGLVGSINTAGMTNAVREGYASASTDTGHIGSSGRFALGHPDKITDFAYRAVHETAVEAKALIAAYYGRGPRLSYWEGCSTGGRQGLMSAQRYPEDFDGIIAGAPAYNQIDISAWRMRLLMTALKSPQHALPPEKLKLLNEAVLDKCDGNDGVKDRLIEDPRNCDFDPGTLKCNGAETANCLTPQQLETVNTAYTDVRKSTGELLFPRLPFGGELGWRLPAGATEPGAMDIDIFRYIANQDPAWDWRSFDLEKDIDRALLHGKEIHAVNPDLAKFKARGGKLLMYHGWSDGGSGGSISALNTVSYYELVLKYMGPNQDDWFRLFMVPGMDHCGGGTGPNQFNKLAALERWREQNEPPKSITAVRVNERGVIDMTRPLCPYPQRAVYKGSGSTNDAENYACKVKGN